MNVPSFLKLDGSKLICDVADGEELVYYLPDAYFSGTKTSVAIVIGEYVSTIGVFDWGLVDKNGKRGKSHPFKFPTIFICKPSSIEKVKDLSLNGTRAIDYSILHFKKGDEAVCDINVPQDLNNVEILFKALIFVSNKLPPTVPYNHLHEYFTENMLLNGKNYGLNMQMFGIMISELCRDAKDVSKPFRLSKYTDYNSYRQISIVDIPKFISPYTSLTSQNWDESLMAAVEMSKEGNNKVTPLEKVVTG